MKKSSKSQQIMCSKTESVRTFFQLMETGRFILKIYRMFQKELKMIGSLKLSKVLEWKLPSKHITRV